MAQNASSGSLSQSGAVAVSGGVTNFIDPGGGGNGGGGLHIPHQLGTIVAPGLVASPETCQASVSAGGGATIFQAVLGFTHTNQGCEDRNWFNLDGLAYQATHDVRFLDWARAIECNSDDRYRNAAPPGFCNPGQQIMVEQLPPPPPAPPVVLSSYAPPPPPPQHAAAQHRPVAHVVRKPTPPVVINIYGKDSWCTSISGDLEKQKYQRSCPAH